MTKSYFNSKTNPASFSYRPSIRLFTYFFTLLFLTQTIVTPVFAVDHIGPIRKVDKNPCPYLLGSSCPQECEGSPGQTACQAGKALEDGANMAFYGAVLYTATAAVCWVACGGYKPFELPCSLSFMGAGAADAILPRLLSDSASRYEAQAREAHKGVYRSDKASGQASTYGASLTAMIALYGASSSSSGGSSGGGGESDSNSNSMSCAYGAISTIMAGWKWTNMGLFMRGAEEELNKVTYGHADYVLDDPQEITLPDGKVISQSVDGRGCALPLPAGTRPGTGFKGDTQLASGGTASGFGNAQFNTANNKERVNLGTLDLRGIDSAATAIPSLGMGLNHNKVAGSEQLLKDRTGAGIQEIATGILNDAHPSDLIGAMVPSAKDSADYVKNNQDALNKELGLDKEYLASSAKSAADVYATARSSGGSSKKGGGLPDFNALLAGLMNKGQGADAAKQAAGVRNVKFSTIAESRAPKGDVFHSDTELGLFDIVSRRWAIVTWRFIEEDKQRTGNSAPSSIAGSPSEAQPARTPAASH